MFPEGTPDMQSLLEQVARMQQQVVAAQEELADTRVTGSSGGGLVTATVSGKGELLAVSIDPAVCDPEETETLADLVLAAVRDASTTAKELESQQMGGLTGGLPGGFGGEEPSGGRLGF